MKAQKKPIIRNPKPATLNPPVQKEEEAGDPMLEAAHIIDRNFRKSMVRFTGPIDIPAFSRAYFDALVHLAWSPGTRFRMMLENVQFFSDLFAIQSGMAKSGVDRRFRDPEWENWPYSLYKDLFLRLEEHLETRFKDIRGVSEHSNLLVQFLTHQITAMMNPLNFPLSNPEVVRTTLEQGGQNITKGIQNLIDTLSTHGGELVVRHSREDFHQVGKTLACTPGKVVYRNRLIELIQYAPMTDKVQGTPILLVPAWINKFYILDLSPHNSMVRYLTEQGFTVFILSWKNVDGSYRHDGIDSYVKNGLVESIAEIRKITGSEGVHLAGYCMGAILCSIAAAYLRGQEDTSIQTLSCFAAQLDFSDAGDLRSFIDESQITFLKDLMEEEGYLPKANMMQTYSLLRPRDLYWNYLIDEFFLGKEPFNLDFLFWNDDGTRMPMTLHIDILERLYLEDQLTEGKFRMADGRSIDLRNIDMDLYSVGTMKDHIAPWKSVYRIPHFVTSPIKFVLASSGHIAGIINPPGEKGHYHTDGILGQGPEHWLATAHMHEGTWWPDWVAWLRERSQPETAKLPWPPMQGRDLGPAPGTYVMEK
ncbi:PHA/PHB synthase family protein [Desulfobotulus sp.]|jgi:polyhydroxyalkanoate synthase|uniref:PHA/PHB synthase family protein n=1 Tax=Desulfobotulus sp. TaxID=1940337 RepID=UPI002A360704|nr:alpha/beta fold hydrolase [Desulfobotulus sp.]MDY0163220.1 alpha/beta fold hydrolase [Desulfobotulus sp.]